MTLTKDFLTKATKKGRTAAIGMLNEMARTAGLPQPTYAYQALGNSKNPWHFMKVRFRVPRSLLASYGADDAGGALTVTGSGKCRTKQFAKSLAALEAVHRLEERMSLGRDELRRRMDEFRRGQEEAIARVESTPVGSEILDASWSAVPVDAKLSVTFPASREGRISFLSDTGGCPKAMMAARAMTLACQGGLPEVALHGQQLDEDMVRFANVSSMSDIVESVKGTIV